MKSKILITIFLLFFQNNITFAKIAPIGSTSSVGSANIMFMLDVSGSMQGSRLQLMKNAVNRIVQDPNLSKNSKFGVMSWASVARVLVGITSSTSAVTTAVNKLSASGETNAATALREASSYWNNFPSTVGCNKNFNIFITDGGFTDNPSTSWTIAADMYSRTNAQATTFVVGFIGGDATQLTQLAKFGSDGKYTYYDAQNETALVNALTSAIQLAQAENLTFETPVITSEGATENRIYQSTFTYKPYKQWEGTIVKKDYINGVIGSSSYWDAGALLNSRSYLDRKIWTVGPGLATEATLNNFTTTYWSSLKNSFNHSYITDQISTEKLINFVRGLDTYNQNNSGTTVQRWKLADIYNSRLTIVGPPNEEVSANASANLDKRYRNDNGYASFKSSNANRKEIILAGSNGGMLHAFATDSGQELWAFIPPSMLSKLPQIINPNVNIGTSNSYQTNPIYGVDGSPIVKDIYFNGRWRTVVITGLGRGGNSFFALDITNPYLPIHLFTIENDFFNSKIYMWNSSGVKTEYTHTSISSSNNKNYSVLGQTWSSPRIIKVRIGGVDKWVAVFGSGYNGNGGVSSVYAVSLQTNAQGIFEGTYETKIDFQQDGTGIPNSITADLTVITPNTTSLFGSSVYGAMVYALTLEGMVYKINLTSSGTFGQSYKLFSADSSSTNGRYTFNTMEAGINTDNKIWLYFGTGNMLNLEDKSSIQNRLIGIKDIDSLPTFTQRSTLTVNNNCTQVSFANTCLTIGSGWYVILGDYKKVTAQPTIVGNIVYYPIYEPNVSCAIGKAILTGLDSKCGYPLLAQTVIGDGVLSQVSTTANKLVIGISTKATKTTAGFQQTGNIITGAKTGTQNSTVTVQGWREN